MDTKGWLPEVPEGAWRRRASMAAIDRGGLMPAARRPFTPSTRHPGYRGEREERRAVMQLQLGEMIRGGYDVYYHKGMSAKKQRLTVTLDPELVAAGQSAVESGAAASVSEWVSVALEDKVRRDRRLALLSVAVADFEREFGEITEEEIAAQTRRDRERATVVRGQRRASHKAARSA